MRNLHERKCRIESALWPCEQLVQGSTGVGRLSDATCDEGLGLVRACLEQWIRMWQNHMLRTNRCSR